MDSHDYADKFHKYDCLVGVDAVKIFSPFKNQLSELDNFYAENDDWIFGHLGYDLKNEIEGLTSLHINKAAFADIFFFIPSVVLCLEKNVLTIHSSETKPQLIFNDITSGGYTNDTISSTKKIQFKSALTQHEYIEAIQKIQAHILRGDCYELNYCQEFFAEDISIEPLATYIKLIQISPPPFSCFYKLENKYLLCASPERFLSRKGNTISSQPIKGTAPRNTDVVLDNFEKENLSNS